MNSISCKNLSKTYFIEKESLLVLKNIDLIINEGDRLAITGKSGSGKSSLLHILAGLDAPTTGSISYNENNYEFSKPDTLRSLRLGNYGFVYQFHHLLDDLTVEENILIPCHLNHSYSKLMIDKAKKIMKNLDIYKRKNHLPWKLSGGEKQRTAIARSIINNPKFLFLDEPTGNLDNENGRLIQEVLINISKENNIALITATHDNEFIKSFNRVYRLSESNLYSI